MKFVNSILGIVPPLVWALLLAACGAWGWFGWDEAGDKERARAAAQTELDTTKGAVLQLKKEAKLQLESLTAERDRLQKNLDERHRAQEKRDANHAAKVGRLERELRSLSRAGGGPGLRDPHAQAPGCGGGGGAAAGGAAGAAADRAGDAPEAGGLLSAPLEALLLELTRESDAINRAYAACRADTMIIRGRAPLPEPPAVVEDPS